MADHVQITKRCDALRWPNEAAPAPFRIDVGSILRILRDEDRAFYKVALQGQALFIPKSSSTPVNASEPKEMYERIHEGNWQTTLAPEAATRRSAVRKLLDVARSYWPATVLLVLLMFLGAMVSPVFFLLAVVSIYSPIVFAVGTIVVAVLRRFTALREFRAYWITYLVIAGPGVVLTFVGFAGVLAESELGFILFFGGLLLFASALILGVGLFFLRRWAISLGLLSGILVSWLPLGFIFSPVISWIVDETL